VPIGNALAVVLNGHLLLGHQSVMVTKIPPVGVHGKYMPLASPVLNDIITSASRSVMVTQNPGWSACNSNICHWPVGFEWTLFLGQLVCNGDTIPLASRF